MFDLEREPNSEARVGLGWWAVQKGPGGGKCFQARVETASLAVLRCKRVVEPA